MSKPITGIQAILQEFMNRPDFNERYHKTVEKVLHHEAVQKFINENHERISQEMIQNSISRLNEFVLEYDLHQAGQPGKNPGFVPILFINQHLIDIAYQETPEYIAQQKIAKSRALIDNRMMSRDVREANLETIFMESPRRRLLMTEILEVINDYRKNPYTTQGLYISGPFGVGKTYILGAFANRLAESGVPVTMLHYPTFVTEMKEAIGKNMVQATIDSIKKTAILIIDDIGAESNSAWIRDDVLGVILEYRMKESLTTFFTSNFSMEELAFHLQETRDASESIKAARLMERMRYLAKEVHLDGENLRQKNRFSE